jgi:sugar phosphate isomerase/epimerase
VIAAQLHTVRDRLHDRHQLVEVLGRLHEIGYEGVEVASLGPDAADHFGDELTRAGLKACSAHESDNRNLAELL